MKSDLLRVAARLASTTPDVLDGEQLYLHREASSYLEEALVIEGSDDRRNYERDYELELADKMLDRLEGVKELAKGESGFPLDYLEKDHEE